MKRTAVIVCSLAGVGLLSAAALVLAGPINPPAGPVGSTYKTLTEVEPRIALSQATTPGDPNSIFKITQPGSYYLTGNVDVNGFEHGIEISLAAEGAVTIDLNGFMLLGREDSLNGIDVEGPFNPRVVIRNGHIMDVGGNGVDMTGAESATIENVECSRNSGRGFVVETATLIDCKAKFNSLGGFRSGALTHFTRCHAETTGPIGFEAGIDCVLTGCSAKGCTGDGFDVGDRCVLVNCVATTNAGDGIFARLGCSLSNCTASSNGQVGIVGSQSCTLTGCVAMENGSAGMSSGASSVFHACVSRGNGTVGFAGSASQFSQCEAIQNLGDGFLVASLSNLSQCTAASNGGHGISGAASCLVVECIVIYSDKHGISLTFDGNIIRGNVCSGNGEGISPGAGIHTEGLRNRIEGNNCQVNDIGIDVDGTRSVIIGNVCGGNTTTNWSIVAGNSYGPIIDRSAAGGPAVNGNSAVSATATTDPTANFTN